MEFIWSLILKFTTTFKAYNFFKKSLIIKVMVFGRILKELKFLLILIILILKLKYVLVVKMLFQSDRQSLKKNCLKKKWQNFKSVLPCLTRMEMVQ